MVSIRSGTTLQRGTSEVFSKSRSSCCMPKTNNGLENPSLMVANDIRLLGTTSSEAIQKDRRDGKFR